MKKAFTGLILGICCWAVAAASLAETKYAVCVGINKYKEISSLSGCVNDANYFYTNLVERGGWQKTDMTLLRDSAATKNAIRKAVSNCAAKAVAGDVFVYQQSSHGGQRSGKNTFLCVYDEKYSDDNTAYNDYEIAADLQSFADGVKVVVIVDACHSGGLFKGVAREKGPFNLAERVTAIMDENRAQRIARGERGVEKTLQASEIGWVTAADYTESSLDGGYYDSSTWLTDPNAEGRVMGGVFLGAFTWAWWNGTGDAKSGYGDNDSYADAYECWKVAYDFCTKLDDFWNERDCSFTPQCTNITVLKSVELGWVGDEEPSGIRFAAIPDQSATVGVPFSHTLVATNTDGSSGPIVISVASASAPADSYSLSGSTFSFTPPTDGDFSFSFLATNAAAGTFGKAAMLVSASLAAPTGLVNSGITASSFTAGWEPVTGAASYLLDVASNPFGAAPKSVDALVNENFDALDGIAADVSGKLDDYLAGTGWSGNKVFAENGAAKLGSSKSAGWIATPQLDLSAGGTVSFDLTKYDTDVNSILVSTISGGVETQIGTATPAAKTTVEFVIPTSSSATSVKIATSAKRAYIDNLVVTGGGGADVLAHQPVDGTSYTVEGLETATYYWRVRAVGNAKGPQSDQKEVTLVADPSAPPSIRAIDDIAVTVGETATATVTVSSPEEAPATVFISSGDAAAKLENGLFSFAPAAPGDYPFTITASNANGSVSASFAVAAALATPEVPTASVVASDSFTATWTAIAGAESYELDVVQGASSGGGSGSAILVEDFSKVITSNSSTAITDFNAITKDTGWSGANVYPNLGSLKLGTSTKAGSLKTPALDVSGSVTVQWSAFSWSGDATKVNVGVSEDGGVSFTETAVTLTDSMAEYTTTFPVSGKTAVVRWQAASASRQRFFIDDISVFSGSKARDLSGTRVEGFPKDVGNTTSFKVEGLQPLTEYSFAFRAIAGETATDWSEAATVKTSEGPSAPVWSEIPPQAAAIGFPYSIDLSAYVDGSPTPTLSLVSGDASLSGTVLGFTPAGEGTNSFTVSAANGVGDPASVSFDVVATEHRPTCYAVCVGINEYKEISSLEGCVNDSRYMAANLVERGAWDESNVTLLNDAKATKKAIRAAISNVAAKAAAGDTFVYQHSSHGGQFNATEDDEDPLTGEEGKATFLCVYDEVYEDNTTAYNDYEIAADLAAFPAGVKVAVIVDACHSGGLFKSREAARASAASFDLAGRVSAIMEADRSRRMARGENVAKTLAPSEIGWATAAEYYEYSYDGGFYHTNAWLENPAYGDEYWNENTQTYNYPVSYKQGGVFLASATWAWWDGTADADADAGDNDGFCDAYEFWKKGYDFCSVVGEFWYDDSSYNYFPQCTNVAVLKSVELGWVADPRLPAPVIPEEPVSEVSASSFVANWEPVENAVSYNLYVQQNLDSPAKAPESVVLLKESFEDNKIPDGWIASAKGVGIASGKEGDGNYCVKFSAADSDLITPALSNPSHLSFMFKKTKNADAWTLDVAISESQDGPWTSLAQVSDATTTWQTFSLDLDVTGTRYIKFGDKRLSGTAERYIDLVQVTGVSGTWVDVPGFSPLNVEGTSQLVDGLEMGTEYRFSVTAIDAEDVESAPSERVTVKTEEEDCAPVWKPIPVQSAVVDVPFTFNLAAFVSGSPAPTLSVAGSVAAIDGTVLSFTPDAVGLVSFTLTAANSLGSASTNLDVDVAAAPTTVPTLALSNPTKDSFDAAWDACTGVSSYTLQVATDDQFTTGSAAGTVELFNNPAGSATAPEGWTYDISSKTGKYVVLDDTAQSVVSPAVSTKGMNSLTIAFKSRTYGGTGAGLALVEYSADGGSTWAEVGTAEADSSTMASRTLDAAKCIGLDSVKFRWTAPNATGIKGIGIQNLALSGEGSGGDGSLVKELTVEGTSTTVTGLEPETLYYARVKGAAEWSAVESIATVSDVPTPPEWLEIPAQTATIGQVFELDLSSYVTGSPFPTITVDGAVAEGGNWSFTPDEAKTYAFELVATNTQGSDSTTLTVVAEEAPPAKYALCVGLNDYDYAAWYEQGWSIGPLKGCVNDATFLKTNLTERGGWADADVTLLTNETATKDALRAAIADYAKRAKAGDTFIYQHSSHGLNNENLENDEYTKDVALATYAAPYEDFELAEDLAAFADGVKVVIAIDACHSAGMFKKGVAATAGSFDIAARVSALMDANRVARKARGEDVSRNLSSDQVGWITAADYDEESKDGGYYDTDEWLSDDDAEGEVRGGTFLASLTWGWWSGKADVSGTGDGDGWFDAYEGWGFASPVCIDAGFTPQFLNESVLRSVELGYAGEAAPSAAILFDPVPGATVAIGEEATLTVVAKNADGTTDGITLAIVATDPEGLEYTFEDGTLAFTPEEDGLFLFTVRALSGRSSATKLLGITADLPAPVALDATDVADDGFTANWTGVDAAQGYQLQVSTDPSFPAPDPDMLVDEGFDGVTNKATLPERWDFTGTFGTYGSGGEAAPSIKLSTDGATLTTPAFELSGSENGLSFWTKGNPGTSNALTSTLAVQQLVGEEWQDLGAPFVPSKDGETKEIEGLDSSATRIRFVMAKLVGNIAIDDVKVVQAEGAMVVDDGEIPAGTVSYEVEDLDPGTTYYYRVRALANTRSAWSETIEVTTTGEAPLPVPDLTVGNPVQDPDTAIYAVWLCDGVAKVQLQVASDAEFGAESLVFDEEVSDDVCLVSGLTPETTYYVRARALVGERVGEWSEVQSVTTAGGVEPEEPEIGGKDMEDFELSSDPDPVSGKRSIKTKATGKLAETFSSVQLEYATELVGREWNFDKTVENGATWPEIEFEYPDVDFAIMRFVFE